ncbi:MAG: F0F1 ATP synthase subunit alpha [Novosphingobium sp.]|nr:F0F1 ATP synthase subunit alpha [Novosphingobium sp.]
MAEAEDWIEHSRRKLAQLALAPTAETTGRVIHMADGIAMVSGLPDTRLGELLRFETGQTGLAMTLDADAIGTVLLDSAEGVEAGTRVSGTGEVLRVPVGPGLLGRVVDPLGRPLDGGEPIAAERFDPTERDAPSIIDRDLVRDPVETGLLVVDALFALGRGQRELIIGDRATGKTALAVEAMIAQKHSDVICVYIAVGQRVAAIERVVEAVRRHGAPERTIFVVASAATPPGLQWIAPAAGITMAEYFRDRGGHALVVIDDLSKHAATHRELSLLTRSPPGREAYPGDIFYQHAHLLERAAHLSPELGGGSLSALPIVETDAGNLSAYIPTNLISITDGQIVLDSRLFAANQRPPVDVGLSVSRVGGKTQKTALRDVSGKIRLEYAQFLELEIFTRFGGISDKRVAGQIRRGERIRALLRQPRFEGLRMIDQVALLAALEAGVFDEYPAETVGKIRTRIAHWLDSSVPDLVSTVTASGKADETSRARLVETVRALAALAGHEAQGAGGG